MDDLDKLYDNVLPEVLSSARSYLHNQHEFDIEIDKEYDFGRKKWVASYVADSVFSGTIAIGLNKDVLLNWIKDNVDEDNYRYELTAQLGVSVWHEIGHALVQYYRDLYDDSEDFRNVCDNYKRILRPAVFIRKYEEENVEEFGEYMMRSYTGQYSSILFDALALMGRLSSGEE